MEQLSWNEILIQLDEFILTLKDHLLKSNEMIDQWYPIGNISLTLENLEFSLPIREEIIKGEKINFVLLEGKIGPKDRLKSVKIE